MTRIKRAPALQVTVFLLIAICFAAAVFAQSPQLPLIQTVPLPPDPVPQPAEAASQAYFGRVLAADARRMVVGPASGHAAYAYRKDASGQWTYDGTLLIPDGSIWMYSAVVSDDLIAVDGNAAVFPAASSIYVFRRTHGEWHFTQKIVEPAAEGNSSPDFFGYQMAYDGNVLVATNFSDNDGKGAAYIFRRNAQGTLIYQTKLDGPPVRSQFGWSVAAQDRTIIVGSQQAEGGAAYVFELSHGIWELAQILKSPTVGGDPAMTAGFAHSVALDGRTLIVGSLHEDEVEHPIFRSGAAFVYRRVGHEWQLEKKLVNPTGLSGQLGLTVGAHGRYVAVTMWSAVFVFRRDGGAWNLAGQILGDIGSALGAGLTWSGHTLIASQVGLVNPNPVFDGEVDVFALPGPESPE